MLNYKPDSSCCGCKYSGISGICAEGDNYVTAEKVRNAYLGLAMNHETLLAVFRQHNEDYEKQVGKLKRLRSYWKYCTVYKHLAEFIKKRYKVSDIALKELTPAYKPGAD